MGGDANFHCNGMWIVRQVCGVAFKLDGVEEGEHKRVKGRRERVWKKDGERERISKFTGDSLLNPVF